jgi:LuxR family maltose regulon positive regulatory protein
MSYPITRTKIIPPRGHKGLLSRQRLLGLLDELLDYRLTLVIAPAGYGKTSLLVDQASRVDYPLCWLSLDAHDADLSRFLNYVVAAVQVAFPAFGAPTSSLLSDPGSSGLDLDQALRTLVNDLYDHVPEHFALVLDDFHLVEDSPGVIRFLNRFIQEMDENCHLVIASRTLLDLPDLPLMVGRSQVMGLSFEELAFNPQEFRELYLARYRRELSAEEAARLAQETEGWITGFLLSAEAEAPGSPGPGSAARAAGIDLYDYLAGQVLDQQTPELQDFLLRTSWMEEFDQGLCLQALGEPGLEGGWGDLIQILLQKNLFVQPVESGGTWLRYHHLFRDFLQQHYQSHHPQEVRELLGKLAGVYRSRGWLDRAYAVLLRLGDEGLRAEYLKSVSADLVHSGQISLLKTWLEGLSPGLVESDPGLLAIQGGLASLSGDPVSGLWMINRALAGATRVEDPALLALLLVRRAACHRLLGSYQPGLEDALQALQAARGSPRGKSLEAEAEREIGLLQHRLGEKRDARAHLERSLAGYLAENDQRNAAFVEMDLGYMEMNLGHYQAASSFYRQAYRLWEGAGNLNQLVGLCNNLGVLDHLTGAYREAFQWFTKALDYARQTGNLRGTAFTLTSLGDLALDLGALSRAESFYSGATELAEEVGDSYLKIYLQMEDASLARRRGHLREARRRLDAVQGRVRDYPSGIEKGRYHLENGLLLVSENLLEEAVVEFQMARETFLAIDLPVEACLALVHLARLECLAGDQPAAEDNLGSVQEAVSSLGTLQPLVPCFFAQEDLLGCLQEHLPQYPFTQQITLAVEEFQAQLSSLLDVLEFSRLPLEPTREAQWEIRALGGIELRQGGEALTAPEWVKQRAVRELLVYLLSRPEGASRDEICLAFWPESSPQQLSKQIKNAFYRLRRVLGREAVAYDPLTRLYRVSRNLDHCYDVEDFQGALARAEREQDPGRRLQLLGEALQLYRGPFAPEIGGIWAEPLRHRLYLGYERAALAAAEGLLSRGLFDRCQTTLEALLEANPGQEEAWRLSMRLYAARGDRSGVERAFQRCQRALARQLEAEPSAETLDLYRQLMA